MLLTHATRIAGTAQMADHQKMSIPAALASVAEADLQRLIEDAVPEGRSIEYKSKLNLHNDDAKRKFLASLSSFANAQGGDVVFGIEADAGVPRRLASLPGFVSDTEILRMENLMSDSVSPRVFGIDYKEVPLAGGGSALVVRVPRSWNGPHMVTFNKDFRFYTRAANGRLLMDVPQLRAAFAGGEAVNSRIRDWRADRINRVLQGETPLPLLPGSRIILHVMPLASFEGGLRYDLRPLTDQYQQLRPLVSSGCNFAQDFESYFSYEGDGRGDVWSYVAVFRSGQLEAVDARTIDPETQTIEIHGVEGYIRKALPRYFDALQAIGLAPPYVIALSLLGVRDRRFATSGALRGARTINRDPLIIPPVVWEESVADPKAIGRATRPLFDAIWNAVGLPQSQSYDPSGALTEAMLKFQQNSLLP